MSKATKEDIYKILQVIQQAYKEAGKPLSDALISTEEGDEHIKFNKDEEELPN